MDPAQTNNHKYTSFVRCLECLEGWVSQSVKWLDSQPGHQSVNQIGPVLLTTTTRPSFFSTRPVKVLQVLVANSSGHSALHIICVTYHNIPSYIMPHHPCRCSNSFIDFYLFSCFHVCLQMKNEFSWPRGDQYRSGSPGVAFLCVLTFCRKDGSPSA